MSKNRNLPWIIGAIGNLRWTSSMGTLARRLKFAIANRQFIEDVGVAVLD
jgi:hypothetical protein